MKEYTLCEEVVRTINEKLKNHGVSSRGVVRRVVLKVGALDMRSKESFKSLCTSLTKGTLMDPAELQVLVALPTVNCPKCAYDGPVPEQQVNKLDAAPSVRCPQCRERTPVLGGRGVEIVRFEVDEEKMLNAMRK